MITGQVYRLRSGWWHAESVYCDAFTLQLMEPLYLKDGPSYILKVYAGSDAKRGQVRLLDPKRQNDTKLKYT